MLPRADAKSELMVWQLQRRLSNVLLELIRLNRVLHASGLDSWPCRQGPCLFPEGKMVFLAVLAGNSWGIAGQAGVILHTTFG